MIQAQSRAQIPHFPSVPPALRVAGFRNRRTITATTTRAARPPATATASDVLKTSILPRSILSRPVVDNRSLAVFEAIQPLPTVVRKGSISNSHIALEIARYAINSTIAPVYQGDSGARR